MNSQDLHRKFEIEMTGWATPQFVESAWSAPVTALNTIVVYHQLSGSSSNIWNGDDRKIDTSICRKMWSVSVTALYTFVVYHQFSGSSSVNWNGDDRKSDASICWKGLRCFSNNLIYDCCILSIVRIFIEYLKWRWQQNWHLNLSKGREVFQ